jgi:hypothetical protein
MTWYELFFIFLFLATAAALVGVLILAVSRRRASAGKLMLTVGAIWCIYLVILAISDLTVRQKVTKAGEDRCFDEMCFAVVHVQTSSSPYTTSADRIYAVTVRVTSHSRGRTEAEGGIRARLYAGGKYFDVSQQAQKSYDARHGETPGLTQRLAPGESIQSVLLFEVPQGTEHPALTLDHGFTPGYFVIGESPFFHRPDILQLPKDQ